MERLYQFRRAEHGDLPEILRVIAEARAFIRTFGIDQWQDGYPDENVLRQDIELEQLYVMADAGHVGAVAALSLLPEPAYDGDTVTWNRDGRYMTIHRMALEDAARGSGLASELLAQAEKLAKGTGCESLRIDTHRGNRAMRRFVEKHGFRFCGTVYYYVKTGDPERVAFDKVL